MDEDYNEDHDEEYNEDYNRFINGSFDLLNSLTQNTSKILMKMSKEAKIIDLKEKQIPMLKRLFIISFNSENYEVCQVIKEILEERGIVI